VRATALNGMPAEQLILHIPNKHQGNSSAAAGWHIAHPEHVYSRTHPQWWERDLAVDFPTTGLSPGEVTVRPTGTSVIQTRFDTMRELLDTGVSELGGRCPASMPEGPPRSSLEYSTFPPQGSVNEPLEGSAEAEALRRIRIVQRANGLPLPARPESTSMLEIVGLALFHSGGYLFGGRRTAAGRLASRRPLRVFTAFEERRASTPWAGRGQRGSGVPAPYEGSSSLPAQWEPRSRRRA
jgi:hypothetical protein